MFLALKELIYAKTRYLLIGFIIVLVASLIFIISGLAKGLSANNASALEDLPADYIIMDKGADTELAKSTVPKSDIEKLKNIKDVQDAAPLSIRMANTTNADDKAVDIALFVTDKGSMLIPKAVKGSGIKNTNDIILDETAADDGVKLGDTLKFGDMKLHVAGFSENQRYSHTPVAYVTNEVFGDQSKAENEKVNGFAVKTNLGKDEVSSKMKGYSVFTKKEALKGIPSYSEEQASLQMMIVFLLIIAAFVLAVFFYVMTLQKRGQFGILKALGAKTGYLVRSLLSQVATISIVCIAVGAGLTYLIGKFLPDGMPFVIEPGMMAQSAALILVMALAGSLVSMFQVARIDPLEAIEGGEK
ncbi:ABC transporter permease [Aciduricibacillus chroicocephali]|uniref:Putative hemin transport system permease protein HrtB n=1 Tax=Aciduricibacillus chroicocephali TaxID=3054939 RepID=A0ABY9KVG2_9BACI|nr:ABC transporter permease [Bacillaceae bacterium 44XB]